MERNNSKSLNQYSLVPLGKYTQSISMKCTILKIGIEYEITKNSWFMVSIEFWMWSMKKITHTTNFLSLCDLSNWKWISKNKKKSNIHWNKMTDRNFSHCCLISCSSNHFQCHDGIFIPSPYSCFNRINFDCGHWIVFFLISAYHCNLSKRLKNILSFLNNNVMGNFSTKLWNFIGIIQTTVCFLFVCVCS